MKVGRNDQCPCGSGKKYKKCCLPLQHSARPSPVDAQQVAGSAGTESALAALQPEGSASATDQPHFWEEYGMASVDARIDILRRVVEEEKRFDGELAYELLVDVVEPLQHIGRPEDADAALDLVRERQPGAYRDQASWFDEWRVENALLAGQDVEGPLLEFASRAQANVDGFFLMVDRLLYHGKTEALLMGLGPAWNALKDSPDVTEKAKQLIQRLAVDVVVDHQLSLDPSAAECSPELLEQIASIVGSDRAHVDESFEHRARGGERHWRVEDFGSGTGRSDNGLFLLAMDFSRLLFSRDDWPPSRANLAAHEFGWYLASAVSAPNRAQPGRSSQRRRGKKRGDKDSSSNQFRLAPTAPSADRYVADLIDPINPRPTRAATFYEALPPWIDFLVGQSLIPETEGPPLTRRVIRRLAPLSELLEMLIADPVMKGNVRRIQEAYS